VLSVRPDGYLSDPDATGALPSQAASESRAMPDRAGSAALGQMEESLIRRALEQCGGNLSAAARALGVTRPRLAYRARKRGITS
jgi:transcriptional regulator with GAF, ATPase, and Fis domain